MDLEQPSFKTIGMLFRMTFVKQLSPSFRKRSL